MPLKNKIFLSKKLLLLFLHFLMSCQESKCLFVKVIKSICRPGTSLKEEAKRFVLGGIHDPSVHVFWEQELNAGEWVMDVIRHGYTIPFVEKPPSYEEENNATAKRDMEFVREAVRELVRQGVARIVSERPFCVSPLTVSARTLPDGSEKKRLCWDGSRCVNLLVKEQPVKLAHLQRALEMTRTGDFQVKYDLQSAFHPT